MPNTSTQHQLKIEGRLAGINELIAANRSNRYAGAELKRKEQQRVEIAIIDQLNGTRITNPVIIEYTFYEKDHKRDLDNISGFAHKVIQDALVARGILQNDGWEQILGYTDYFRVDKKNPRIEVRIEERKTWQREECSQKA